MGEGKASFLPRRHLKKLVDALPSDPLSSASKWVTGSSGMSLRAPSAGVGAMAGGSSILPRSASSPLLTVQGFHGTLTHPLLWMVPCPWVLGILYRPRLVRQMVPGHPHIPKGTLLPTIHHLHSQVPRRTNG